MVACTIAIPAVAIFGKSLPDFLWDQCCRRLAAGGSTSVPKPAEIRSSSLATANPAPELTGLELPKSASWPNLNQAGCEAGPAETQMSAAAPSGQSGSDGGTPPLEEVVSRTTDAALAETPVSTVAGDQFTAVQQRLRRLGATWYVLETWGNEGRFRFTCRIPVDEDNPGLDRLFQASDAEALPAMVKVLHDVERWKASPRP
jgi:hypothetical protein